MTEDCVGAAGEHRRKPLALSAEAGVPDGVDTTVHPVESTRLYPNDPPLAANPGQLELVQPDHPMLSRRDARDNGVRTGLGAFCIHVHA